MTIGEKMDDAWDYVWKKLFYPETGLFYDCLTSYAADGLYASLPTPEEIKLNFPNPCGWRTGMEDSMLNGSPMLLAVCDRFTATNNAALADDASRIFAGMRRCARISSKRGFLARSISPFDKKSYYINSSRDQYTLFAYAAWRFYHSQLSTAEQKSEIAEILVDFAGLFEREVIPENNYTLLRLDGGRALVSEMWGEVMMPHESLRLPMIYAAAWDVTGHAHWFDLYRRYAEEGVKFALTIDRHRDWAGFAILQMQCSQRLLYEIEKDARLRALYAEALAVTAGLAERALDKSDKLFSELNGDLSHVNVNWHEMNFIYLTRRLMNGLPFLFPEIPETFIKTVTSVREAGEGMLVQLLCPDRPIAPDQVGRFLAALKRVDYQRHASCGPILLLAAYWRAQVEKTIEECAP